MQPKTIPANIKKRAQEIVERFNESELGHWDIMYSVRFRGSYMYLDRDDGFGPGLICCLAYTSDMGKWEFAIYRYSKDRYNPDEWWFPGAAEVDGTVDGALRAGMKAYG